MSSKFYYIVKVLLVFNTLIIKSTAQWTYDPNIPLPQYHSFKNYNLFNDSTGIIVEQKLIPPPIGPLSNTSIYKTTNRGQNWNNVYFGNDISNIFIFNENKMYGLVGNKLYVSSNGGVSWNEKAIIFANSNYDVNQFYFIDELKGYAVGTTGGSSPNIFGLICKTTDGGATWDLHTFNQTESFLKVKFISENIGFVSDAFGMVFKTTDGGNTWNNVLSTIGVILGFCFVDSKEGWAYGGHWANIYKTTDEGNTWEDYSYGVNNNYYFYDAFFFNREVGWVIGTITLYTNNGGHSWEIYSGITDGELIEFYYDGCGWILTSNGAYKTLNGGGITSIENNNKIYNYSLSENYPNPFNPNTTISYQLPQNGMVTLKIYDILGAEIATLVNEEKVAGKYEVNFNAISLASGVYIYRINAGTFVKSKNMLLLK